MTTGINRTVLARERGWEGESFRSTENLALITTTAARRYNRCRDECYEPFRCTPYCRRSIRGEIRVFANVFYVRQSIRWHVFFFLLNHPRTLESLLLFQRYCIFFFFFFHNAAIQNCLCRRARFSESNLFRVEHDKITTNKKYRDTNKLFAFVQIVNFLT